LRPIYTLVKDRMLSASASGGLDLKLKASCLSQVQMGRKFCQFLLPCKLLKYAFWATVCKTVRPMLLDRCLPVCPVCDVGVLWPNGWMDQHATWYGGRPPPWPHCVRWGPRSPKGAQQPPIFDPCLLWPNGWMDQDAAWYRGMPRLRPHCVRWGGTQLPTERGTAAPNFSAHV